MPAGSHEPLHGNDLPRVEAQLLVVVQHSVHVLNPDGVHGAVEDDPLAVRARVASGVPERRRAAAGVSTLNDDGKRDSAPGPTCGPGSSCKRLSFSAKAAAEASKHEQQWHMRSCP